jgi:hypothetical protein
MTRNHGPAAGVGGGEWHLEIFSAADGSEPFSAFIAGLDDFTYASLDAALRLVLARRGIDLARSEWLKPLGDGLHEFRVRHDASEIECMFGGRGC